MSKTQKLDDIARGQREIAALLAAPVVPQYDDKGKIIGAQRKLPAAGAAPRATSNAGDMAARIVGAVQAYVARKLVSQDEKIAALEQRIAELEQERSG